MSTDRSVSLHMAGATESGRGVQSPRSAAQQARHRLLHLPDPRDCDGLPERVLRSPQAGGQSSLWTVNDAVVVCFMLLCLLAFFFISILCCLSGSQELRLLYYLIREVKTWLNINRITLHNNTYCVF